MRITTALYRQHIGFMFKKHWHIQGQRKVQETNAAAILSANGLIPKDPNDYLKEVNKKPRIEIQLDNIFEKPKPLDNTHPDYKEDTIYLYQDFNVLVQGVPQAQVLLKTLVFGEFPEKIEESFRNQKLPNDIERSMQQSVLVSHLLDAQQNKTIKIVNPLRPMRPYPRNYGISDARKNMLLSSRLLSHCERFQGHIKSADRKMINNAFFVVPFEKNGKIVQLEVTAETLMVSKKPIVPINASSNQESLPDIFPVAPTASIPKVNFYNQQNVYPVNSSTFSHPHTVLLHYSTHYVRNLFRTPVNSDQFESRAMLKGFAVAASRAQSLYGSNVKELKKPIVVQVVHLDGKQIQFGIFQLNTLDLEGDDGLKNYWFSKPAFSLYDECCYNDGRPLLSSYNYDVFRLMNVFYSN